MTLPDEILRRRYALAQNDKRCLFSCKLTHSYFLKRLDRQITIRSPRSRSYVSASGNVRLALGQVCAMPFDYLEQFRIFDVPESVVTQVFG
jgi:hypothetical protein